MAQRNFAKEAYLRLWNLKRINVCQYVNEDGKRCEETAINSHTVQRGKALVPLAENGHLLSISAAEGAGSAAGRNFTKIGNKKASVFPGFCDRHDANLFASLENQIGDFTKHDLTLIGYRSVCHEAFKKEKVVRIYSDQVFLNAMSKHGKQAVRVAHAHLRGSRLALADLERQKSVYETALHSKDYSSMHAAVFNFFSMPPFVQLLLRQNSP